LGRLLLTPEESLLLEAIQIVEPTIQRIAPLPVDQTSSAVSQKLGIFVLPEGKRRLSLGTLGDGAWRLVMLATAMARAAGGVLLVDEIDTGLHYSVLEKMWHLVLKTAARLDVQVFATTHSGDCWRALARVLEADPAEDDNVALHRLEADRPKAVTFPGNRIRLAAESDIEVR
jgi:predicted ATPase